MNLGTPTWRPVAPRSKSQSIAGERAQARSAERLAAALAMIAGFIDAYGMITYGVYVSFMSGNTTQTGYQTAEGAFGPASLSALAILFFVVGSFAGTLLVQFAGRDARPLVYGVVAAALAAIVASTQVGALSGGGAIASISFAMGIMNNALSRVGAQAVSVTFVTGALSRLGVESRARAETRSASRLGGALGHPSATGGAARPPLARVSGRRDAVGRGHAAVWRAGASGSGPDPRRPGGVRSFGPRRRWLSAYSAATAVTGT